MERARERQTGEIRYVQHDVDLGCIPVNGVTNTRIPRGSMKVHILHRTKRTPVMSWRI